MIPSSVSLLDWISGRTWMVGRTPNKVYIKHKLWDLMTEVSRHKHKETHSFRNIKYTQIQRKICLFNLYRNDAMCISKGKTVRQKYFGTFKFPHCNFLKGESSRVRWCGGSYTCFRKTILKKLYWTIASCFFVMHYVRLDYATASLNIAPWMCKSGLTITDM